MTTIFQLSDLHLLAQPAEQETIFDELVATVREVAQTVRDPVGLLAITGDVFDSATLDPSMATHRFKMLHKEICRSLGSQVPTVIVPGNHDRRRVGLFGPHRPELFKRLRAVVGERVWVHGCDTPFLSQLIPHEFHGLPLWIVAYDTTYLPRGLLSAGGALRQEDLLEAAARIGDREPDWPVLILMHHHLVPTPLTDLGAVPLDENAHPVLRWGVQTALPALVANADREELTMTATGAGTALSTLHTLGRAVLVLHGHKHYATARLLDAIVKDQGDVLIASAGSTGLAQSWSHDNRQGTARLWPSFNVIEWDEGNVSIDMISFAWKEHQTSRYARRPLVRAERTAHQWRIQPLDDTEIDGGPRLSKNRALYVLERSRRFEGHWDMRCEREVRPADGSHIARYIETVDGYDGALCFLEGHANSVPVPAQVHVDVDGITLYRVEGALGPNGRTAHAGPHDDDSPFASVAFMNRYSAASAQLEVRGLPDGGHNAFGSATDLGTGLERPIHLDRKKIPGTVIAEIPNCHARTLLRIYWRLNRR